MRGRARRRGVARPVARGRITPPTVVATARGLSDFAAGLGALATRPELVFQVPNGQQKNEESIFILWVCAIRESFREKALKLCDLLGERTPYKKLGFSIPQRLTVSVLKNHQVCLKWFRINQSVAVVLVSIHNRDRSSFDFEGVHLSLLDNVGEAALHKMA